MPRTAPAAPTGRYRMAQHGTSSRRQLAGVYILKDSAGFQIWRPTWNMTRTVVRIFPMWDPENPQQLDPFRISDEDRDFGDWIRRYDAVTGLGTPGVTYILRDPRETDIDIQQNPAWVLYRAINSAVQSGQCDPAWNPLIFGAQNRKAPLDSPTDIYLVQGVLLEHRSKPCNPPIGLMPDHQPVVVMLSQSAGEALLEKANEEGCPDLISFDSGAFVDFHQLGVPSLLAPQQAAAPQQPQLLGQGGGGGAGNQRGGNAPNNNRYEVDILPTYNGSPAALSHMQDQLLGKIKPWDDIVRIPTVEEQVGLICTSGLPASAVVYALGDLYGDHIPEHVHEAARHAAARTQVQGGFGGAPQQSGQAGGAPAGFGAPGTAHQPPTGAPTGFAPPAAGAAPAAQPGTTQDPAMPPAGGGLLGAPAAQSPVPTQPPAATQPPAQQPPAGPPAQQPPAQAPAAQAPVQQPPAGPPAQTAPPAQAPAAQQTQPPAGFDAQPTHADAETQRTTAEALERARNRARQAGGQ